MHFNHIKVPVFFNAYKIVTERTKDLDPNITIWRDEAFSIQRKADTHLILCHTVRHQ